MADQLAEAIAELEAVPVTVTWADVERRGIDGPQGVDGPNPVTAPDPGTSPGSGRRWSVMAVAAAILIVALVGAVLWRTTGDDGTDLDTTDTTVPAPSPFDGWAPGWNTITAGPVPHMGSAALAWIDDSLVVAGGVAGDGAADARAFRFRPADRSWTELPVPPFSPTALVAADDVLVAVGYRYGSGAKPQKEWATLQPGDAEWRYHGTVPTAPALAATGFSGPGGGSGSLVWTGQRVVDVGPGAALDPATGTAAALPMPDDLLPYTHLLYATPVWNGRQVVLVGWSDRPGLAWDATGSAWTDFPAPISPAESPDVVDSSAAVVTGDGRIVLVSGGMTSLENGWSSGGVAAAYDDATGRWDRLAHVPAPSTTNCPYRLVAVAGHAVVVPCDGWDGTGEPLRLTAEDGWISIGPIPGLPTRWAGSLLGTDDALFVWTTSTDTTNDAMAPYTAAEAWIPTDAG